MTSILKDIAKVWVNEYKLVFSDVGAMIFIIFLPLAYPILYSLIYNREVVKEVPIVVVDECRTPMSREYARMLDATEQVRVADYAVDMQDARRRMAEREAYGIVYLPSDFSRNVGRGEQARMEAYCDMSVILRYKNIVTAITTVNSELGGKVQMGKVNQLENPPSGGVMPIPFRMVPVGNNSMGMGSAIIPGILALILQQAFLLCIACVSATSRERRLRHNGVDTRRVNTGAFATLIGKALCYVTLMVLPMIYLWRFVPIMFAFPQHGNVWHVILLSVPYMLAVAFFGLTLQTLVRKREAVFPVLVVTSVFFLFLSGISWPRYAMNGFWNFVGDLIPSTWCVQAIWGISSMGATLAQQREAYCALWVLVGVYFVVSYAVLKFVDHQRREPEIDSK